MNYKYKETVIRLMTINDPIEFEKELIKIQLITPGPWQLVKTYEEVIKLVKIEFSLLNKNNSFDVGRPGEICVMAAIALGYIPSTYLGYAPVVTANKDTETKLFFEQAQIQRINGDIWFTDIITGNIIYVDVKNVAWLSEKSLGQLKDGNYIFFNAWYRPTNEDYAAGKRKCIPFMIKNCIESREFIQNNMKRTQRSSGDWGYEINFNDMKPEWCYNFDSDKYLKLMRDIMDIMNEIE